MSTPSHIAWLRQYVGPDRLLAIGASAAIFDSEGRLLLGRRSDGGSQEIWGFPGGAMEPSESILEAVVREVQEETGLTVDPGRLVGVYSSPDYTVTYPNGDVTQYVIVCFECRVLGGALRADGEEMLEWGYFGPDRLPPLRPCCQAKAADAFAHLVAPAIR